MTEDFITLIISYLKDRCTDEEKNRINKWLEESKENKRFFDEICDIWYATQLANKASEFDAISALKAVKSRIGRTNEKKTETKPFHYPTIYKLLRVAAIFILAFLLGVSGTTLFNKYLRHKVGPTVMTAPIGSRATMVLPDGTRVWLNAGSTLSYTERFNKQAREVGLEGEAYFDVAKNPKLPFIVDAGGTKIRAIGTSFNVKAYPEEKRVETTLVNGLVEVGGAGVKGRILLKPNQKIIIFNSRSSRDEQTSQPHAPNHKESPRLDVLSDKGVNLNERINTEKETCWKDGKLIFEREPLKDLVVRLERRYDVKFTFDSEKLKNYRYTGSFNDVSLEQIMDAMRLSSPVNYEIKEKQVKLMEKPYNP